MLAKLVESHPYVQPVLCCTACREVYLFFVRRPTITLDEVLDMHYAMEH